MKPWEGPGKAFTFLRELNEEKYEDALEKGLSQNLMIDVHAEADNVLIMTISFFFQSGILEIAARSDCMNAIKFLIEKGYDIHHVDQIS